MASPGESNEQAHTSPPRIMSFCVGLQVLFLLFNAQFFFLLFFVFNVGDGDGVLVLLLNLVDLCTLKCVWVLTAVPGRIETYFKDYKKANSTEDSTTIFSS